MNEGVRLSEAAARHVREQLLTRGKGLGVRLGVETTGCSGLAYVLEFVDEPMAGDERFEQHGVSVFIDPKSLIYLKGVEVDYAREDLNEGLVFKNPNASGECGCGESFHV